MTLQELQSAVQKLCEDTKTIMESLALLIEEQEKGGPGSGRKPGGGSSESDDDSEDDGDSKADQKRRVNRSFEEANNVISQLGDSNSENSAAQDVLDIMDELESIDIDGSQSVEDKLEELDRAVNRALQSR